jgi:hypothetical protein
MQPRAFCRLVQASSAESVDSAFHGESFDFTAFLGRRLGVSNELAGELLGTWLKRYQPNANSGFGKCCA